MINPIQNMLFDIPSIPNELAMSGNPGLVIAICTAALAVVIFFIVRLLKNKPHK